MTPDERALLLSIARCFICRRSFRAWLRQVTVNKIRNWGRKRHRRPVVGLDPADEFLERLSDPNDDLAREWDHDHDKHVVEKLLARVRLEIFSRGPGGLGLVPTHEPLVEHRHRPRRR